MYKRQEHIVFKIRIAALDIFRKRLYVRKLCLLIHAHRHQPRRSQKLLHRLIRHTGERLVVVALARGDAVTVQPLAGGTQHGTQPVSYTHLALKAEQYYNNADYENAIAEFKAAGDYGDAASRVTEATYRLGAQQLANGEVRKAYDTLYPIRSYDPAYMLLVSNSQFYIQIYDVGAGPNPLNEN